MTMTGTDLSQGKQAPSNQETMAALAERVIAERRNARRLKWILGLGFPGTLILLWEVSVAVGWLDGRFFPPPSEIVVEMTRYVTVSEMRAELWAHARVSIMRLSAGYSLGVLLGLLVGILIGLYRPVRFALRPMVFTVYPMPKMAIFPLLIVLLGIGESSKIALIALGTFFMVCINTMSGIMYSSPIYSDVVRAFNIPRIPAYFQVMIPSALPAIITGLKLGIGNALIMLVTAEFLASSEGIGYLIWSSWQTLDVATMFVGLTCIAAAAACATATLQAIERKLTPWAQR